MKPFDLERALAGDKVVTRDGHEVTQLHKFDCNGEVLAGVVNGYLQTWHESGEYSGVNRVCDLDLFMAPKTIKRWVNFYKLDGACDYETEAEAKNAAARNAISIAVPVEFEEGFGIEVNK